MTRVELVEDLFEQELLVGALCLLNEFEPDLLDGRDEFFRFRLRYIPNYLCLGFGSVVPHRCHVCPEGQIAGNVYVQVVVEVQELLFGEVALGSEVHHRQQLPLQGLLGLLAFFELLELLRIERFD